MNAVVSEYFRRALFGYVRVGARLVAVSTCLSCLTGPTSGQSVASSAFSFTTMAGHSTGNGSLDGVGENAVFDQPMGTAVDSAGNVYVADTDNNEIRQITPFGVVTTIAGMSGSSGGGYSDNQVGGSTDGFGSVARFYHPWGVTVDISNNVYVAEFGNLTVRKITPAGTNWIVSTIAGQALISGTNDGAGTNALFTAPRGIAVDTNGDLFVTDGNTIREITPVGTNWIVNTIIGQAWVFSTADGTNSEGSFGVAYGITIGAGDNIFVTDAYAESVRQLMPIGTNWVVTTLAGGGYGSNDGTNKSAQFNGPTYLAVDSFTNLYVSDSGNDTLREIQPQGTNWVVTTLAGMAGTQGDVDAAGTNAEFGDPEGVAVDSNGNVFVADGRNSTIREITSAGSVSTLAGAGNLLSSGGVNGTGESASFTQPCGVAVDAEGYVYVVDTANQSIRKISPAGAVTTMAGTTGSYGSSDGVGSSARFLDPFGVALDRHGNLYVTDTQNYTIRKITPAGVVTTIAGKVHVSGTNDGLGTNAEFAEPNGIAVDSNGNIYVADSQARTIRMITPGGMVTTIAGSPAGGYESADGTNSGAHFEYPLGVAVDSAGHVYVTDFILVREMTPIGTNWVITTIAGSTNSGSMDGTGTNAQFLDLYALAVDNIGDLYAADWEGDTIRKLSPIGTNWLVTTIGGVPRVPGNVDGLGTAVEFSGPEGIAVDNAGNLYVGDTGNNTIRKGVFVAYTAANPVPYAQPPMNAQLMVTLLPPGVGGQWRFPWETGWHNSGDVVSNLVPGNYTVEFSSVGGFLAIPSSLTDAVTNFTLLTNTYYPTVAAVDTNNGGLLTVNIGPSPPPGAGWRFLGDSTPFFPPGYSTNLAAGIYLLEFAPVSGFTQPPNQAVQVGFGIPTVLAESYSLAQSPPVGVLLPAPVPVNNIGDLADYPFGFDGQLESDVGYGSGVAVGTNVVLTAAHLVFNDQTLSYVSQANWFYQEEQGTFDPEPMTARGWYLLTGYATQRTNDVLGGLGPDQSSPQSRNLDVAALYFLSPVANGGYNGFLPSDDLPNQWLTSAAEKMLVGYPVDGSLFGDTSIVPGRMYQDGPQSSPLALDVEQVNDEQVYTASWFLGYPGNSGGPLYVQYDGYYYPAGVYLGTLFNGLVPYASAVRAIDSNVVSLITLASSLGDTGTNNSGGGVITIIPSLATSRNNPGYLVLQLGPPSAVQAGAAWKLTNQAATFYSTANPSVQEVTTTNAIVLVFKPIPGWNLPTNASVSVIPGPILTNFVNYTVVDPVLTLDTVHGLGITGTTNTIYRIQSNATPFGGTWVSFKTNTVASPGLNVITNKPGPGYYRAVWLTN